MKLGSGKTGVIALLLFMALAMTRCSMQMASLVTVRSEAPTAEECGKCHGAIFLEWRASAHAEAWTSPAFAVATADRQIEACLPCHAPETVFTGGAAPRTRDYRRDEGVTCLTCHLHEGAHHGPFQGGFAPHAVSGPNPLFHDSALCGVCHRGTYASWKEARASNPHTRACQTCHMPRTRRKLTEASSVLAKPFVAMHEERDVRRHRFDVRVVENFAGAMRFEARKAAGAGSVTVVIRNNLPHPIPTGDYGYRHARLTIECLDESGGVVATYSRDFFRDLATAAPVGEPIVWRLPEAAAPSRKLRATVESLNQSGQTRFRIARQIVDVGEGGDGQ